MGFPPIFVRVGLRSPARPRTLCWGERQACPGAERIKKQLDLSLAVSDRFPTLGPSSACSRSCSCSIYLTLGRRLVRRVPAAAPGRLTPDSGVSFVVTFFVSMEMALYGCPSLIDRTRNCSHTPKLASLCDGLRHLDGRRRSGTGSFGIGD